MTSGVDIVSGGFHGDEGKGKIIGYLAVKDNYDVIPRCGGGSQTGHSVNEYIKVRQIPSGLVNPKARLLIGRGTVLDPKVTLGEIEKYKVADRIGIDYGCTIIEPRHIDEEQELVKAIGSVGTGTGPARRDRVMRKAKLAKDVVEFKPYLTDVSEEIQTAIRNNKKVLIEGTQGFALSLMDYKFYPYVTSQDTTASQFASDAGIGPKDVGEIYTVFKAYVSKVGGGELPGQWSEEKKKQLGIEEIGTVSRRERRFSDFDLELAKDAIIRNTTTQAAITCIDRLFKGNQGVRNFDDLTEEAKRFIMEKNDFLKHQSSHFRGITLISTGPNLEDTIDMRGISY